MTGPDPVTFPEQMFGDLIQQWEDIPHGGSTTEVIREWVRRNWPNGDAPFGAQEAARAYLNDNSNRRH